MLSMLVCPTESSWKKLVSLRMLVVIYLNCPIDKVMFSSP